MACASELSTIPPCTGKTGENMDFEKLQAIIAETLNIDESKITLQSSFEDDLGADSLDLLNVVMAIEEQFSISISDGQLVGIKTVEDG